MTGVQTCALPISGLVVGSFTDMQDTDRPFGKNINEIIADIVQEYKYPVCYDFPVGHGIENRALKIGVTYNFTCAKSGATLAEN